MKTIRRRTFLAAAAMGSVAWSTRPAAATLPPGSQMAFGLVTYQWGNDWDLDTLIRTCEAARCFGVELRTTHAHGVEPTLDRKQRAEVRERFAASQVTLVGLGSNERFDSPDPATLKRAVETTKEFIRLSHDVGGTGVKVKPDRFHDGVPRQETIAQIGRALNEVAEYGAGYGQQLRMEVHGQCAPLSTIKQIMDIADHPNAAVCWNSNAEDLNGAGLRDNFLLVRDRLGATCHVRELDSAAYPFPQLIRLLVETDYQGWVMLESANRPDDRQSALAAQVRLFEKMVRENQAPPARSGQQRDQ